MFNLIEDIFKPIVKRIKEKKNSLINLKRFKCMGIEGWLKVEVIAALGEKIQRIQNKGPDLVLKDRTKIELKAATDFSPNYFRNGATKYQTLCLFLGDGSNKKRIEKLKFYNDIYIGAERLFNDGVSDWIVGIIIPSQKNNYSKLIIKNKLTQQESKFFLDESKHELKKFLEEFASADLRKFFDKFHSGIIEFSNEIWADRHRVIWARTNRRGVTYFCSDKKAFIFLDFCEHFISLTIYTGNQEIPGVKKGIWLNKGDNKGGKLHIKEEKDIENAIEVSKKAYIIARDK